MYQVYSVPLLCCLFLSLAGKLGLNLFHTLLLCHGSVVEFLHKESHLFLAFQVFGHTSIHATHLPQFQIKRFMFATHALVKALGSDFIKEISI